MAKRLNLHIDKFGNQGLSEGRYLLTVVLHDHSEDVDEAIGRYEARFAVAGHYAVVQEAIEAQSVCLGHNQIATFACDMSAPWTTEALGCGLFLLTCLLK